MAGILILTLLDEGLSSRSYSRSALDGAEAVELDLLVDERMSCSIQSQAWDGKGRLLNVRVAGSLAW